MAYSPSDFALDKSGPQFAWLDARLTLHGFPPTRLMHNLKDRVRLFQLAQGWTGTGADGLVGRLTLERLTADPKPTYGYPADIFGKNWKVTVPYDGPDEGTDADEIKQPALATYSSLYCRLGHSGQSVLFTAYHGSPTTSGSKNTRSELREMVNQGLALAKWDGRTGEHRMAVELAVNELTEVKPDTVLAQIHNGSDDITTLRAEGIDDTDRMELWISNGNTSHGFKIGEVVKGQRFTFAFDIAAGKIRFDFNGTRLAYTVAAAADCFFKVGAYLQSNPESAPGESSGAFTQVEMFGPPRVALAA
jgi:hypothetical protein